MQNEIVKVIGRRPVYPVYKMGDKIEGHAYECKDNLASEESGQTARFRANHTITVLGRLSSYLSDK